MTSASLALHSSALFYLHKIYLQCSVFDGCVSAMIVCCNQYTDDRKVYRRQKSFDTRDTERAWLPVEPRLLHHSHLSLFAYIQITHDDNFKAFKIRSPQTNTNLLSADSRIST